MSPAEEAAINEVVIKAFDAGWNAAIEAAAKSLEAAPSLGHGTWEEDPAERVRRLKR